MSVVATVLDNTDLNHHLHPWFLTITSVDIFSNKCTQTKSTNRPFTTGNIATTTNYWPSLSTVLSSLHKLFDSKFWTSTWHRCHKYLDFTKQERTAE